MENETSCEKVINDFKKVVETVDEKFGKDYSIKNPSLVQHLISAIQQQEDRKQREG